MCGRFSLMVQLSDLQLEFGLKVIPSSYTPSDNISPGSNIPVITNQNPDTLDYFYWGLVPSWAKDISIARNTFNARAETLSEKPSFKNAFKRRRCIIPATGYYEWKKTEMGKIPYLFTIKELSIISFAGLWEYWMDAKGNEIYSTTIITCPPNEYAAAFHDRMPVILKRDQRKILLGESSESELRSLLEPIHSDELKATPADL